jgi:hypothetical protein
MNESELSTINQIMATLNSRSFDTLPEDALRAAREHREQIIPLLIEAIQEATVRSKTGEYVEENAHFYGLFLLSEFEAKEALPAIVDSVLLPGEIPHDMYGDTITEKLSGILAALDSDPFDEIERIITCEDANEFVRWSAAGAYLHLVRDGKMTRDDAVARLKHHLVIAIENKSDPIAQYLICELCDYSPHEAEAEIRQAFAEDLVDGTTISLKRVEESLKQGEEYFQEALSRCRPTGIEDTIEELSKWASFNSQDNDSRPELAVPFDDEDWDTEDWDDHDDSDTIRNLNPKIGRNDPCPCNSGKKYKKCCGGN